MVRIQVEFQEERVEELRKLMEELGLRTQRELINNALTLFEWAVRESKAGHIIASVNDTTQRYKELLMPSIMAVRERTKPEEKALGARVGQTTPLTS